MQLNHDRLDSGYWPKKLCMSIGHIVGYQILWVQVPALYNYNYI
jgi:hypothetical protein